jgi:uncharacterized membrane protein YesL
MGIFDIDNHFFRFVTKLMNVILLNLLWTIFSLPVFTMGAATSAVYYVTLKMVKDEEGYIIKDFWKAFKQNFKQSVILEIILVIIGIILYADIRFFLLNNNAFSYFFIAILAIVSIIYVFTLIYIFPITARYQNKLSENLKSAFIMSLKHLVTSIMMTILLFVLLYGFYVSVPIMVLFPIIAVAGYAYVGSILFRGIFEKY